jgi:mono/diheme cytochrome c family protein
VQLIHLWTPLNKTPSSWVCGVYFPAEGTQPAWISSGLGIPDQGNSLPRIEIALARKRAVEEINMAKLAVTFAMIATVVIGLESTARPQEFDAGKFEYQMGCAACHGIDGKGEGPVSSQVKVPPADLTVLAKKNNGVFPFNSVYEVIDGRKLVIAHGTRDMPIWGNRYMPDLNRAASAWARMIASDSWVRPYFDFETIVRMRILAVIDYLNRIQEK